MLTDRLKQAALSLGFDLAGAASASDPALAGAMQRYSGWLDAGYGAGMEYLRRHAPFKASPGKLLPGWKSVLAVAMLYADKTPDDDPTRAQVSLYTRGRDYHDLIGEKLRMLADTVERESGGKARAFVDSEPVMDRFWAWRAGLGWIGKNSCLLNRKLGSFLFLGGVLTTAELVADAPQSDHCGRCRRCIDACPTGAIDEERRVDSRRCIGYHTIENRGPVPVEIMERTGRWIAGCDICQTVCPWNDPPVSAREFDESNPAFNAPLVELARWSREDFARNSKGIAMGRMKFAGFVRNVAIAVANSGLSAAEKLAALAVLESSGEGIDAIRWARERVR
jgi:epoxyqueuosine reductase